MLKKIFITLTFLFTGLFITNINTQAATIGWNYTNLYASYYAMISDCISMGNETLISGRFAKSDYDEWSIGGIDSYVSLYSDDLCSGGSLLDTINLYDISPGLEPDSVTYQLEMDVLSPNDYVGSIKVVLTTNLTTASAPPGFVSYFSNNTEYEFSTPYIVQYISELQNYYQTTFITIVPQVTDPTKTGFTFLHWKTTDGKPYDYQTPPDPDLISVDGVFTLIAVFEEDYEIIFPGAGLPTVDEPLDIILYNTGFFNVPGFVLIYFIVIFLLNIGLWRLGSPSFGNLMANIAVTAFFMFMEYLPLYISILMILFFIIILILNNKGGLLNE